VLKISGNYLKFIKTRQLL